MACGRRGSTPILVLIMTLSLATPASSAIHMTGNSGLLSRYHDKERDLIFALERALDLGASRLKRDTSLWVSYDSFTQLLTNHKVYTSDGGEVAGLTINLYGAYTGDTAGTHIPYITLLAPVSDATGLRLARRMDLPAQSFSRYGLFANDFPSSASIGAGENISGRVHANNTSTAWPSCLTTSSPPRIVRHDQPLPRLFRLDRQGFHRRHRQRHEPAAHL